MFNEYKTSGGNTPIFIIHLIYGHSRQGNTRQLEVFHTHQLIWWCFGSTWDSIHIFGKKYSRDAAFGDVVSILVCCTEHPHEQFAWKWNQQEKITVHNMIKKKSNFSTYLSCLLNPSIQYKSQAFLLLPTFFFLFRTKLFYSITS